METPHELNRLVSEDCLSHIRDHIKAGVVDAEAKFDLNEADEDAVTGALGQAISTATPITFRGTQGTYSYQITSRKIRGRGPDAEEKTLGADAMLQISVSKNGHEVFTKGLPFQAKKEGGFGNVTVKQQAEDLYKASGTGVIVRYSKDGYTAVDVRNVIDRPDVADVRKQIKPRSLATVFGDDFLNCVVGRVGLYLHEQSVRGRDIWVFDTKIRSLESD
jgi:hypothetical protein